METLALQSPVVAVSETGRRTFDAYFTAQPVADAVVARLCADGFWRGGTVLEPSAGRGAFAKAIHDVEEPAPLRVFVNDVDRVRVDELQESIPWAFPSCTDFVDFGGTYDLILGNPPYSHAEEHVRHALAMRKRFGSVAFLLRLAFLESANRFPLWRDYPASKIYVLSERPSFTGGGTDNSAYGFFVWAEGWKRPTETEVISWREPVKRTRAAAVTATEEPSDLALARDVTVGAFKRECAITRLLTAQGLTATVADVQKFTSDEWSATLAWLKDGGELVRPEFLSRYLPSGGES